jgi:hypothetical protein
LFEDDFKDNFFNLIVRLPSANSQKIICQIINAFILLGSFAPPKLCYFLCLEMINVHFFCSSKRNEPKKRAPEMTTSAKTGACYTSLYGATVLAEVRAISGLPTHSRL